MARQSIPILIFPSRQKQGQIDLHIDIKRRNEIE